MRRPVESAPLRSASAARAARRERWRQRLALLWADVRRRPALSVLLLGYVAIFVTGWWCYFTVPQSGGVGGIDPLAAGDATEEVGPASMAGRDQLLSPRPGAVFGTDRYGVGVLTRILRGSAETLSVALVGSAGAVALSYLLVLAASWIAGPRAYGWLESLGGSFRCIPVVALAWWLSAALEPGFWSVTAVVAFAGGVLATEHLAQAFRAAENAGHVLAARVAGLGRLALLRTEVLPFIRQRLLSFGAMLLPGAVLLESALSFAGLGLGEGSPDSWGRLIAEGRSSMFEAPWLLIAPGLVLAATVGWLSLTARSLRKATHEKFFLSLV